jgi:hypothetical protein
MAQEVPYITIKSKTHQKASNISNLVHQQKKLGFPVMKKPPVEEYITIPFPDFCTIFYEITIWTQFETQINEILEKIFFNYDVHDSFVMWSEYDNETKKGNGYRFVGFREGSVSPQGNIEELSDQERLVKCTYRIRVPAYLILDPKDEALSYGRNYGSKRNDDNSKYVYKNQNAVSVQLKEELVSSQIVESLNKIELDIFGDQQLDKEKQNLFNLLSTVNGGSGGGGGSSPTLDGTTPQPIAIVGSPGSSGRLPHSDHVHAHGNLPGGSLHDLVSLLSAGFIPALSGAVDGYAILRTGSSASWGPVASSGGGGPVTGSDNFFVNQRLTVSGSIINPVGHLILSSSAGSKITVSGSLEVLDPSSIMTRGRIYNDVGDLILSSSDQLTRFVTISGTLKSFIPGATGSAFLNGLNLQISNQLGNSAHIKNNAVYFGGAVIGEFKGIGSSLFGTALAATTTGASASLLIVPTGDVSLFFDPNNFGSRTLKFSGSGFHNNGIFSPNGHLILSGASGSITTISGNLKVTGDISSNNLDSRYVLTSSYDFFTASFSSSVQSIGDLRYVLTGSSFTQRVNSLATSGTLIALGDGTNPSLIVSGSRTTIPIVISGSSSGSIVAVNSDLILSSSAGSIITISGSLRTTSNATILGNGTISGLLTVSTAGSSFTGAGNSTALTINGGAASVGIALAINGGGGGNPTGGTGIGNITGGSGVTSGGPAISSITGGAGGPNGAAGINTITGGTGTTTPGVALNATGGAATVSGNGARAINATGGAGAGGGNGGSAIKAFAGTGQGSGSAEAAIIGQGGVHGISSGSRQSGIAISGSGVASGSGGWFVGGEKGGHAVVAFAGLSTNNGVGNAYVVSGTFASASILATETHLILSSSAGSMVFISGGLALRGPGAQTGRTVLDSAQLQFTSSAAALFTKVGVSAPYFGAYNIGAVDAQNNTALSMRCGNTAFLNYSGGIWEWFSDLSVDGITAAKLRLSASAKANVTLFSPNGHLILSSSVTSSYVTVSGNLKVTTNVVENATQAGTSVDTTAVVVDSFLTTEFRAMKYIFTVTSGSSCQAHETFILQSGSIVQSTQYAALSLPGNTFVGFTASLTGSTLSIIASGSAPGNTVKFIRNAVVI